MELLQDLFPSLAVKQAVYTRVEASAPWGFDFIPYHHTKFGIVTEGVCHLDLKDGVAPLRLERGHCYLLTRGDAFRLRDAHLSATVDFEDVLHRLNGRLLCYGGGGERSTIVGGRFIFASDNYPPLFDLLPPLMHFKVNDKELGALIATLELLAHETGQPSLGSSGMVERLADIFFIQSLRAYWLAESAREAGWLGAVADERLSRALARMHKAPAHDWSVAGLASDVGMSRAVFAARFKEKVGIAPMTYLTRYRLHHARRLLQQTTLSIAQIAEKAGYGSEAAFSKAFRREFETPPGALRRHLQADRSAP